MAFNFFSGFLALGSGSISFSELSGSDYSRQKVVFSPIVSGLTRNNSVVTFQSGKNSFWGSVTQAAIYDDSGNQVLWWNLPSAKIVDSRNIITFAQNEIAFYSASENSSVSSNYSYSAGSQVAIIPGGNPVVAGSSIQISSGIILAVKASRNATLEILKRVSAAARFNNPRINAVMASPPTITVGSLYAASHAVALNNVMVVITGTTGFFYICATAGTTGASSPPSGVSNGQTDGTVVWNYVTQVSTNKFATNSGANSYLYNSGTGNITKVANLFGGIPTNDVGTGTARMMSVTVAGTLTGAISRLEFVTDSAKFVIRVFDVNTVSNRYRLIVNNQFASLTAVTPPFGGWNYILIDFTSAGGAASRTITLETDGQVSQFDAIDVAATEGVYMAGGDVPLRAMITGDSYAAGGGVVSNMNDAFSTIMCDLLGIRNLANAAVGGTGLLVASASGTAISRVSDITAFAPDILFVNQGRNDTTFTPTQVTAAMLAYLQAIRASAVTANIPIFVLGIAAGSMGGASWAVGVATENAIASAVTQMADQLIFFIPCITDAAGSWMTGTGFQGATNGTGNSDNYVFTDNTHPNLAGNIFLAGRYADAIYRALRTFGNNYSGSNW